MTALPSPEKPAVVFNGDSAIYHVSNGNVIHYRRVGGIFYHVETPEGVVQALEEARSRRRRVRISYGDRESGRSWLDEYGIDGYIGNSTGPLKVPLLIYNRRTRGGPALLDHCIVKVKWTRGRVLYRHPGYHTGVFTVRLIGPCEQCAGENLCAKGFTHVVAVDGESRAHFRSARAAERYVDRMRS